MSSLSGVYTSRFGQFPDILRVFMPNHSSDSGQSSADGPASAELTRRTDVPSVCIIAATFVFVVLMIANSAPLQSANDRSRWCTVWSLVERGTYHIDEIDQRSEWSTIDKVRHRNDEHGPYHFYSSKPPLYSTIVAGLYWLEKKTLGYNLTDHTAQVTRILLVVVNAIPMLFALLSLKAILRRLHVSASACRVMLLVAGVGSMLTPFLTTLNNHTPAAVCVVFCLSAMIRLRIARAPDATDFMIVGLTAALTCCFELPAALFGLLSFAYVVSVDWKKTLAFYVPAAVIPLAAFFMTNWICTGGIKPFYSYYGTEKYVYVHEGIPSYWSNPQGIDASQESTPVYLFHCLLGHHGLFSITPLLLLTVAGWGMRSSGRFAQATRPFQWMGVGMFTVVLAFYMTRTENYNYGGNTAALRWMLWLTPFFWMGMVPAVQRLVTHGRGLLFVALLFVPSVYSVAYSVTEPWRPGWIFDVMQQAGWIDYSTPVEPFDPPRYCVLNSVPDRPNIDGAWFGTADAAGAELRLTSQATANVDGEAATIVRIEYEPGDGTDAASQDVLLVMIHDRFRTGDDIVTWAAAVPETFDYSGPSPLALKLADLKPLPDWAATILRGLPATRRYNAESPRYLRYRTNSGERTAIRCERGAARVSYQHADFGRCWHRCDVLYSAEVPYGMAQWRITVTKDTDGSTVRNELWTSRKLPQKTAPKE